MASQLFKTPLAASRTGAAGYRLVGWLEFAWTRLSQRLERAVFDEMTVEF
jgi:hypothetical protein